MRAYLVDPLIEPINQNQLLFPHSMPIWHLLSFHDDSAEGENMGRLNFAFLGNEDNYSGAPRYVQQKRHILLAASSNYQPTHFVAQNIFFVNKTTNLI